MTRIFLDISVTPDFNGLPSNVYQGLIHLTNNAAAVLTLVAGLGLTVSLIGLMLALHRKPAARRASQERDRRFGLFGRTSLHRSGGGQLRRPSLQVVEMGDYTAQADQIVNSIAIAVANWSTAVAVASIRWLLSSLGQATEPDLTAIVPVYDRMLAIALLILGAIIALALIERIAWSSSGSGLALVPRVVAATFFAYAGLGVVKYLAGYAALIATAWSPDFASLNNILTHNVAVSNAVAQSGGAGSHVSTFGLIVTALTVSILAVMVHLELVIRSALILTVTAFVPLVCVLSIWPRLTGAATQLASFMIGLLLSKFVVATAVYVGFRLVVVALTSATDTDTSENWMASGVAVLLIAALSPLVLFQAVRIGHASAGQVARGWVGGIVAFAPPTRLLNKAQGLGVSIVRKLQGSVNSFKASKKCVS